MRIKEKEVTLKNGRKVILRSPDTADAEAVIQHFSITSGETYFMARYPEEIVITVEEEKEFLRKLNEDEDNFMIAAFLDGQLVGNAGVLKIQDFIKLRHRGGFGISIREHVCGLGLGTLMLLEVIEQAKHTGFEQLELEVFADNKRAKHLYENMGFQQVGILPRACKLKDGTYRDEIQMVRFLDQETE